MALSRTYLMLAGLMISAVAAAIPPMDEQQRLDYEHGFIEGTRLKLLGDMPGAAELLTTCTRLNPFDAAAYFQLSEIYQAANNREAALRNARRAVQYDSTNNVWYKMHLASLYAEAKQIDSTIFLYEDLVRLRPGDTDMRFDLSLLYLENGQWRKARRVVKAIERNYGFTQEVAIAYYRIYANCGKKRELEKVLLKSVAKFPDELRFYGLLAEFYSSIGKEKEAQANYRKLLAVDPENAMGYVSMIEFYKEYGNESKVLEEMRRMYSLKTITPDVKVELYLSISADTAFLRRHYPALDSLIATLGERYPDNFRVRMVNADRNLRQHNYEAAKSDLLFLTNSLPTNAFLWEQLCYLLNLLHDNETLYVSSGKALEHFENNYLFHFFHGLAAYMLKRNDNALTSLVTALEYLKTSKNPNSDIELQIYLLLGDLYNTEKKYARSDEAFGKALELAPNNALALNNYSYYLSLRGEKLDLAEQYIKRCIAIEPKSSTYMDTYGWVLYKLGHLDEAIVAIQLALQYDKEANAEIVEHLCELLIAKGETADARTVWEKFLAATKQTGSADEKIKEIEEKMNKNNLTNN